MKLLIIAPDSSDIYQSLSDKFSAREPNIWAGLLANSVRQICDVEIYDAGVERPTREEFYSFVKYRSPDLCLFVVTGQNPNASSAAMAGATAMLPEIAGLCKIAFVGPHVNALPVETLMRHPEIDIALTNEGVYALKNLVTYGTSEEALKKINGIAYRVDGQVTLNPAESIVPQDRLVQDLPGVAYDLMPPLSKYRTSGWHANYIEEDRSPFASIYTSLGCIFKCLSGDTPINTIYGMIPIKELSEKYSSIPVYTRDPNTHKVMIADAINIKQTGNNQKLLRVEFDDGSHIDCTPDHKFMTFVNGNQFTEIRESIIEAKDLKPSTRVRAIKYEISAYGRCTVRWSRRDFKFRSRLNMEYKIGRELLRSEHVHHIDKNVLNDSLDNLEYCMNAKEHFKKHPEISERMREDNPSKYWTEESKFKVSRTNTGKKRSIEQRINYKNSKLGSKNPNYKNGDNCGQKSRINDDIPNHKVLKVYEIDGVHDTFCMEVPGHGWFYANNVLVKNCSFCMINQINRTNNDPTATAANFNTFRYWEPSFLIKQFDYLASQGVKQIKIADEMFVLKPKHFLGLCDLLIERDYGFNIWAYTRIDTVKEEYLDRLKAAGVNWLALGVESGNQLIRKEITKGRFEELDIRDVVSMIKTSGINTILNYIVGLGSDTWDTMQQTLNLALELCGDASNIYCATALPGSPLYMEAKQNGTQLPDKYSEFGFLSYDHVPNSTPTLSPKDIVAFRDYAFIALHQNPRFLDMIGKKFGPAAVSNVRQLLSVKLNRKLLNE